MNRKGYMLVEIILAFAIAFGISYFMIDLTIKLKNKNDDLLVETLTATDQTIITNKLMEKTSELGPDFNCDSITISGNTIKYGDEILDIVNEYVTIGTKSCTKDNTTNSYNISIPLEVTVTGKKFNANTNSKVLTITEGSGSGSTNTTIGKYVRYVPTRSSWTGPRNNLTANATATTIAPNELTLWRIININDNGTIDMISEYTSSKNVCFRGITGYNYLIENLFTWVSGYETSGITISSRPFGYNGQTRIIRNNSMYTYPSQWRCSTGENCNPAPQNYESYGGGDTLYQHDVDLVTAAIGTLSATRPNGTASQYWVASRHFRYVNTYQYYWSGRYAYNNNIVAVGEIYYHTNEGYSIRFAENDECHALRPIVTLSSSVSLTGAGTSSNPMTIS